MRARTVLAELLAGLEETGARVPVAQEGRGIMVALQMGSEGVSR